MGGRGKGYKRANIQEDEEEQDKGELGPHTRFVTDALDIQPVLDHVVEWARDGCVEMLREALENTIFVKYIEEYRHLQWKLWNAATEDAWVLLGPFVHVQCRTEPGPPTRSEFVDHVDELQGLIDDIGCSISNESVADVGNAIKNPLFVQFVRENRPYQRKIWARTADNDTIEQEMREMLAGEGEQPALIDPDIIAERPIMTIEEQEEQERKEEEEMGWGEDLHAVQQQML